MAASLGMVCCVNDLDVFQRRLMASDCFSSNRCSLTARFSVSSAAEAFNPVIMGAPGCQWLVWVHQDVFLPPGWDVRFMEEVAKAESRWPTVSVVGVYGISGSGPGARRLGHVLDRGAVLCESPPLPTGSP